MLRVGAFMISTRRHLPLRRILSLYLPLATVVVVGAEAQQQPERGLVLGAPLATFGVEAGDMNHEIGRLTGLAVTGDGVLLALDAGLNTVRVIAPDGRLLSRYGRGGAGPGEFLAPSAIAYHGQSRQAFVLDPGNGRILILGFDGRTLSYRAAISVSPLAHDMCLTGDQVFLYSPSEDGSPPIQTFSLAGEPTGRFGEAFGNAGGPLVRFALGGAKMACVEHAGSPGEGTIVLATLIRPEVVAYSTSGSIRWRRSTLPEFKEIPLETQGRGVRMATTAHSEWHQVDAAFPGGRGFVAIQVRRYSVRNRPTERVTHLIDVVTGRVVSSLSSLPKLFLVTGDRAYAGDEEPFPRLVVYRLNSP